jgi:FKBP-type peptidyl-prolyl cis-trans isomerase (trigger factor)
MQVTEIVQDGLKRAYRVAIPAAHISGLRDSRLAEIARTVPISGYRRGEAPWAAVVQRFGVSVLGEVLDQEVAAAVRRLIDDQALRPAQEPRIEVGRFTEGEAFEIRVALEQLPEVTLPDLAGLRLERLQARPSPAHLQQALARLAIRHGRLEDVPPRPAAPGDVLVCDLDGTLPVDLLANGAGRGAQAGEPGLPPTEWSLDTSPGLRRDIVGTGIENGLPTFDVRLRGTAAGGAFLRIFAAPPRGVATAAGQQLTLCMRARLLDGTLPPGSDTRLGFNERSESDFLRGPRVPTALGPAEMRACFQMVDNPALAYARPVLEIAIPKGADVDVTLRIGPARVFQGAEEPDGLIFNGGSLRDQAVVVGEGFIVPGLAPQFEGLTPGETREMEALLPAEAVASEFAGRRVRYRVTARTLRQRRPLTDLDALAQAVGQADAAALEATVLRSLQQQYDRRARQRLKADLLDAFVAATDFPVPESLTRAESAQVWERLQAERQAGPGEAADAGHDEASLRAECGAIAERRVRLRLLIAEAARVHGLSVSEEELARAIRQDAARYPGRQREVLEFYRGNEQALQALRAPLLEEKVVDMLLADAELVDRDVTPEELGAPR